VVGPEHGITLPGIPSFAATRTPPPTVPSAPSPLVSVPPKWKWCFLPSASCSPNPKKCAST
jgi:hypothetical protein